MIKFRNIPIAEIESFIGYLDNKISFLNSEFGIELKSYGNILRIAINAIQKDTIENLIERVKINKELEKALDNAGGYTIDFLGENNPKNEKWLKKILRGRDIDKYSCSWDNLWLLFIPWHFPLHEEEDINGSSVEAENCFKKEYEEIYKHLLKYKDLF